MKDRNYYQFTGDAAGNVWLAIGDGDREKVADASQLGIREYTHEGDLIPPAGNQDTLKFSGVRRLRVIVTGRIVGGSEDCVDVNNGCEYIEVIAEGGYEARGRHVATIKGRSRYIRLAGEILRHGSIVDIDLGNHSDQSSERTEGVTLALTNREERPITWRRINATTPTFNVGQKYKRIFSVPGELRAFFAWVYALLKKVFRGL